MKNFPTAHKVTSHLKARAHAHAAKKTAKKSLHEVHADNLYKLAHPESAKRQKAVRRTLTHVVLPISLIVATASFAIGAEVVTKSNTKSAPAVPANSVCRVYDSIDGGLAPEDHRILVQSSKSGGAYITTFSGLPLNYLYAFTASGREFSLANLNNNSINSGGVDLSYFKVCAINPGPAMPPFNSRNAMIDQQYRDFLGRNATAAELNMWAGKNVATNKSYTPQEIMDWFVNNDGEKRGPLVRLYKAYYKRWPDAGGYDYWIRKMKNGATLSSVSDFFAKSSEFRRTYGSLSNEQFVSLVYTNVLGRVGDQAGYNYWLKRLNDKKITRGGLMTQFSESSEFKRKYGLDCELVGVSLRMYRRPATDTELAQWNPDESADTLAYPIIFQSAEYANRVVK